MEWSEELLSKFGLYQLLDAPTREQLRARLIQQEFAFGQEIVVQGAPAEDYYLLIAGRARVLRVRPDGDELPLHVLQPGDGFGEIGLLQDGVRAATVRASTPVTVLRLGRADVTDLLQQCPAARDYLHEQMSHRLAHSFLRERTAFADAPVAVLAALVQALHPLPVAAGALIIRAGDPPGPMYLLEEGRVRVFREADGEVRNFAYLRAGAFFGEYSLLRGRERSASVIAETDCRLFALEPEALLRLLAEFPLLRQVLEARAAEYQFSREVRQPLDFTPPPVEEAPPPVPDVAAALPAEPGPPPRFRFGRFPFVPQVDEGNCGAAALAMVCRCFGRAVSLPYLRELCHTDPEGTRLNDLCRAGGQVGLRVHLLTERVADPTALKAPAILHWDQRHWVVLLASRGPRLRLADPATGLHWLRAEAAAAHWDGPAIEFGWTPALDQAPVERSPWGWLWPLLRPCRRLILISIFLTCLISALQLLLPYLTQLMADEVMVRHDQVQLNRVVLGLGAILATTLLLTVSQRRCLSRIGAQVDQGLLEFLIHRMLALPVSYFENLRPADLQRRLEGVRQVRGLLVHQGLSGLLAAVQVLAALSLLAYYSPTVTLAFVGLMAPIYLGLMFFAGKVLRPAFAGIEENEAMFESWLGEVAKGIEAVKTSASERFFHQAAGQDFAQLTREQQQNRFNVSLYEGTVYALWFLAGILVLWLGVRLVMSRDLTIGGLLACVILLAMTYSPLQRLLGFWADWQCCESHLSRLNDLVEWPAEQPATSPRQPVPTLQGHLECRHLSHRFGGPDAPWVLDDVSFRVSPGKLVAVVGRDGAGKTTLLRALATLLTPTQGQLLYDDVDAASVAHPELRRHLGVVFQENYIFSGDFTGNIAFGAEEVDPERVRWAARLTGLDDLIAAQAWGYDTHLGVGGVRLSRGQAQLVGLTRAVYRNPAVFIFDEATSDLDLETQRLVHERLRDFCAGRTVILSSRHLGLVRGADLILLLDHGRLVEQGRHEELVTRRGLYYQLFASQLT